MDLQIQTAARLIFGLIFVLVGSAGLLGAIVTMINYQNSRKWPECTATVTATEESGRTMRKVKFTYVFDAASYEIIQFIAKDAWTNELHNGKLVTIRHNPANPRTSILDHSETKVNLLRLAFSTFCLSSGVYLNYGIISALFGGQH